MKYLLIVLMIACGQNKAAKKDVQDHDGDNVVNALEVGDSKYIANFEAIPKLEGKLKILGAEDLKEHSLEFSTYYEIKPDAVKVLTANSLTGLDEYFSEFSKIKFQKPLEENVLGNSLQFQLYFDYVDPNQDSKLKIYLVESSTTSLIWTNGSMVTTLPRLKVLALIKGKAFLKVVKDESLLVHQKSIENQSNRVFYHDGKESKILYVSKLLPMNDILRSLNIEGAKNTKNSELLWGQRTGWWYRDHGSEKSVFFGDNKVLREEYLKHIGAKKFIVSRQDGAPTSSLNLSAQMKSTSPSKAFMRMKVPQNVLRSFATIKRMSKTYFANKGDIAYECEIYEKVVSAETPRALTVQEVINNLSIKIDGVEVNPLDVLNQTQDVTVTEDTQYLDFGLEFYGQMIEISLKPHHEIEETGIMRVYCFNHYNPVKMYKNHINREARLQLDIEAYLL